MQKALTILAMVETHLPEIRQALGERWPAFADQPRARAASFENLPDEAALADATNQLLGLFVADETITSILTRPNAQSTADSVEILSNRHYLLWLSASNSADSPPEPPKTVELIADVANRFIELCRQPDKVTGRDLTLPDSTSEKADPKKDKQA